MKSPRIIIDSRTVADLLTELFTRRPGYVPEWLPTEKGADAAIAQIVARYLQSILQRLNQTPEKNKLAFLEMLGIELIPAQAARVPIVVQLAPQASNSRMPAGTRLAAPPPPGSTDQITFETEQSAGLAVAQLKQVVSLWPGRDQYIDHTTSYLDGQPLQLFNKRRLQNTPHILYLAHDTLLALKGNVHIDVKFELAQASSEPLDVKWSYWDGKVWREFQSLHTWDFDGTQRDGTIGLTRSGKVQLKSDCAEAQKITIHDVEAFWIRGELMEPLPIDPSQILPEVDGVKLTTVIERSLTTTIIEQEGTMQGGFAPDHAFANSESLDLTAPFYPFGQQPQPGATFYISSEEAFSKPGAALQIYLKRTETPQDQIGQQPVRQSILIDRDSSEVDRPMLAISPTATASPQITPLDHELRWEYWNGDRWIEFPDLECHTSASVSPTPNSALDLNTNTENGVLISLTVPADITRTKVNDQDGLWMRVRLLSGGFGLMQVVPLGDGNGSFTYPILQPPALSEFKLGYTWQSGPVYPEHVFAYNDFQYSDRTYEATWPGVTFQPFQFISDLTPALYLGFDQRLPVDRFNLFFDIVEQRGDLQGPALRWEYWDGGMWQHLSVEDETHDLRIPGMVSLIPAADSERLPRFEPALHWLRARLKEDGPPGVPTVNGIFPNAVWAAQQQTLTNDPVGTSNGQPNQLFKLRQIPVLAGEQIEVRELTGARANVEWRILAMELSNGNSRVLQTLEDQLAAEGPQTDVEMPPLRLRRDHNKRVTEVWVRWQYQQHLYDSGPSDRHYMLERSRGRLQFGNGERGKVPPISAAILLRQYRTGGGLKGNVPAKSITQILGAVGGVETVFNPKPAEGGAESETLASFSERGPYTLRHRGRAIAPQDYETLAKEASPAVAVARAIPTRDPGGRRRPGWVTLVILPQSAEPRPYPSFGLREQVRKFIEQRSAADVAMAHQIYVTGPQYQAIGVEVTLSPLDPTDAGAVEQRARSALETFLHPLLGGPEGRGWQPGRNVFLSDVATVLERVAGVDFAKDLALLVNGARQREQVKVAEDWTVVAGKIRIKMQPGERI